MTPTISFEQESPLSIPINEDKIREWLLATIKQEGKTIESLLYTFCSDDFLLNINKDHLNHNYYTDIITFPYNYEPIESDIFISIDRVIDNAKAFNVSPQHELARVIIHGVLHMCGYNDHTEEEKNTMREKENYYLKSLTLSI